MRRKGRLLQFELAFIHPGGIHADEYVKLAGFHNVFHLLVPELQRIDVNREAYGLVSPGLSDTLSKPRSCFTGRLMDAVTS